MFPLLLHAAHAVLLAMATVAIGLLLVRGRRPTRAIARLRAAATAGELVAMAEARARRTLDRPRPVVVVFATSTVVAAVVHGGVCPEHFEEGVRFGVFFLVVTVVQFGLAVAAARGHLAAVVTAAVVVNAGCVALWLLTRTVGLPFGLAETEPFGVWDTLASLAEVVAVGAALRLRPRAAFVLVSTAPVRTGV